jgi:hypothetical protein
LLEFRGLLIVAVEIFLWVRVLLRLPFPPLWFYLPKREELTGEQGVKNAGGDLKAVTAKNGNVEISVVNNQGGIAEQIPNIVPSR